MIHNFFQKNVKLDWMTHKLLSPIYQWPKVRFAIWVC